MILVRHGESEFNEVFNKTHRDPGIRDPRLTEIGKRQSKFAAKHLRGLKITRIISSPYMRTLETANIIASKLGLGIDIQSLVGEQAKFSCDLGTPSSQLKCYWPALQFNNLDENWWPSITETDDELASRCKKFCQEICEARGSEAIVVVTHWGFIKCLTGHRVKNGSIINFDPRTRDI